MPKGKNFTEAERMLLQQLVLKYRDIVEDKHTDSATLLKKKETWYRITHEFNTRLKDSQKDVVQLKKLWENTKFRIKAKRQSLLQADCVPVATSDIVEKPDIHSTDNIRIKIDEEVDSESLLLDSPAFMVMEDTSQQNPEAMPMHPANTETEQQDVINEELLRKSVFSEDMELRIEKEKFLLQLEQQIGEQRKLEQALRCQLLKVQLEAARHQLYCSRNEEQFQQEKRHLELEILRKRLKE